MQFDSLDSFLEEIQNFKKNGLHFSLDIYYDPLGIDRKEQFVVKVSNFGPSLKEIYYSRNNNILDSCLEAYSFIRDTSQLFYS